MISPSPTARAIATRTAFVSRTLDRSTKDTPSRNRPARSPATRMASVVLPVPPGPVSVSRRTDPFARRSVICAISSRSADQRGDARREVGARAPGGDQRAGTATAGPGGRAGTGARGARGPAGGARRGRGGAAPSGSRSTRERAGGRRQQHLAAVTGRHDPRGAVDGGPEVVAAPLLGLPAVDAHPHPQRAGLAPRLGDQAALRREARRGGVERAREDRHHPVAGRLDHACRRSPRWPRAGSRRAGGGRPASRPGTAPTGGCCPPGR